MIGSSDFLSWRTNSVICPLALEQASAYMETSGKPLGEYLSMFQKRRAEMLDRGKPANSPFTVATTWEISFREVEGQSPATAEMLNVCAYLAADEIPLEMFRAGAEHLPEELRNTMTDELLSGDAIGVLRRYSLMERNADALSVHRLVQLVCGSRLTESERGQYAEAAAKIVNSSFPQRSGDIRESRRCARGCCRMQWEHPDMLRNWRLGRAQLDGC